MPGEPIRAEARPGPSDPIAQFFGALFPNVPPGFIEVRVVGDDREVLWRGWYPGIATLVYDLPELAKEAERHCAAVFFSVLPRRADGVGTAADTLPGLTLWADVDFKDYPGGEAEARLRIAQFPVPPSIIVRSGHGLHLYWLLHEPTEPAVIVGLNHRIMRCLGADHAFDAARVLRVPGTMNMKDPANPILVEIEHMDVQ